MQYFFFPVLRKIIEVTSEQNSDKVSKKYHLLHTKPLDVDSLEGTRSSNQSKEAKDPQQTIKKEGDKQPKAGCQNQLYDIQPLFLEVDHLVEIGTLPSTDFPGSPVKGMSAHLCLSLTVITQGFQ